MSAAMIAPILKALGVDPQALMSGVQQVAAVAQLVDKRLELIEHQNRAILAMLARVVPSEAPALEHKRQDDGRTEPPAAPAGG